MTIAHIVKKYTQCAKHANTGAYTQCVYTDVTAKCRSVMLMNNHILKK